MNASRRKFLIRTGWVAGGLTVMGIGGCSVVPPLPTFGTSKKDDIYTWVQLLPNGQIQYYLSRAELGQGISTGLSQVVAEELNVPLSRIDCRYQSTAAMAPCQMTVGSQSIENYLTLTAQSAAHLRETLRARAALKLDVKSSTLTLIDGGFNSSDGRSIRYPDLIDDGETWIAPLPSNAPITLLSERKPTELRIIGKRVEPVNLRQIVTGTETYSRDVQVEGMHFGVMARPPQLGAKLDNYDRGAAMAVAGVVEVVQHDGQIGVVATTPMAASKGLEALDATWHAIAPETLKRVQQSLDIDDYLKNNKLDHSPTNEGSIRAASADAAQKLSLRYDSPMVAHAAMEPRSGVASWHANESGQFVCEIWTGSQDPWMVQAAAAKAVGVRKSRVIVHNQRVGGAFGGRVLCQASVEAAWLSKAVGSPVKVQWTREEEFRHNYVGPQFSTRIDTGLDRAGRISHWHHQAVGAPILISSMFLPPYLHWVGNRIADPGTKRGMELPYTLENHRIDFADERVPMPTGPWRGLGAAPNTFAVECAMDELALAASENPIAFRLKHTDNPRLAHCLRRLQAQIGRDSQTMGVAAASYKGVTYLALAMQVEVNAGRPQVTRMVCVHDCGRVISPDQVTAQIEGNLVWGIGMALHERFTLDDGIASTSNFDRYQIPRQFDVPETTIELVESDLPPSGAAEAAFAPAAAAIANGIFRVTNQRYRQLPVSSA